MIANLELTGQSTCNANSGSATLTSTRYRLKSIDSVAVAMSPSHINVAEADIVEIREILVLGQDDLE
jgi:hypothetical protein